MRKIIISLSISAVVAAFILAYAPRPAKNKEIIEQFWVQKTFANSNYDAVIAGDSRIYRGVSPSEIEENSSKVHKAINLGFSSGGLSPEYLDFAISKFDKSSKSKFLIVGITPHSLTSEAFKNEALAEYQSYKQFDVFRYKYLSPVLQHIAPYRPIEIFNYVKKNYQEHYKKGGWVASDYIKRDKTRALKSYAKTFKKYQVKDSTLQLFTEKLKNISSAGIKIIAFRPPSSRAMRELEDSISGFNEAALRRELNHLNIPYLELKDENYTSYDGSHLEKESAKKLSKEIAQAIDIL